MNSEEAIRIVEEIQSICESGGFADPASVEAIRRRIFSLRTGFDGPIGPKLGSISSWAGILFSARKHRAYGTENVRHFIRMDYTVLKDIIERTEEVRRRRDAGEK